MAGSTTLVTLVPPAVAANSCVPVEFDVKLIVVALLFVVALPKASCRDKAKGFVADALTAPVNGTDVMTTLVGVPPVMVSCCTPAVRPVAVAVMVGVPAVVSP